ncbi:MAG: hypothetical protein FVQ81_02595 [Candidatus Glassbacteria bacterium]|nr:hypothetical protein [Candidatus Glassbacteria bacterium]
MLHKYLIIPIKLAVVTLLVLFVSTANAEWKQSTQAQGNNVGLTVSTSYGGPMRGGTPTQFPRGSGNIYKPGRWNWGLCVARDGTGDGVANDTLANLSRAGRFPGMLCSLEALDLLTSLQAAGEDMEDAARRLPQSRVYTTSDPGDIADWPAEFREGRSTGGAPIFHGAETIVTFNGDCFNQSQAMGGSIEWRFHFLNFAESNNMVYAHVFFRNMSEYNKWNGNPDITAQIASTPNGQVWIGMQLNYNYGNGFLIGGRDEAWAYYFPREIIVVADRDGIEGSFTGHPAMVSMMMLRKPVWKGEEIRFSNSSAHGWSTEYGLMQPEEVLEGGYPTGRAYRYGNGRYDPTAPFYPGYVNPWTGGPVYGWPGVPLPEEPRYDQWWWGTRNAYNSYNFWGEYHDFAPRDSFSLDAVYSWVQPKNPPFTFPPSDIPNLDNPDVQDQLSTVLAYNDVAEIVSAGGFILPETPAPPPLTIIPGAKQVTITWSDVNINTPDAYYGFLQDNPSLDPSGLYREYDFEGYRLYRSFVGPSDSHSELIWEGSIGGGDLAFHFIDTRGSDNPLFRMNNGMRIWYALVPYDYNYDPGEDAYFSLPDPASGKLWNRPGAQLYTVQPRSDASSFKAAELVGYEYVPPSGYSATPTAGGTVALAGDGTLLTEDPAFIPRFLTNVSWDAVNSERITSEEVFYLQATDKMETMGFQNGRRSVVFADASGNAVTDPFRVDVRTRNRGSHLFTLAYSGNMSADGVSWAVSALTYTGRRQLNEGRRLQVQIDPGGYTGATVALGNKSLAASGASHYSENGYYQAYIRNAAYEISWSSSGGNVTVSVTDRTHGVSIPFSPYIDDVGWGFVPVGVDPSVLKSETNVGWGPRSYAPQSDRSTLLVESLPAGNTEDCALWVAGHIIHLSGAPITMPGSAVMVLRSALGSWDDNTFIQGADVLMPGDKWKFTIKPMTFDPNDADLSKVMVVPNPYMASSALDLSPDQRRIEFVNLPARCTIRIYSLGGHLVNVLNHIGANRHGWGNYDDFDRLSIAGDPREFTGWDNHGGTEAWNLRNRFGQTVASGLYFFHVTDERGETHTGKFYVIN